jgi:uncharacterized damage-inducible protein DinB
MPLKPIYEMFAGYNAWANKRLYDAAAKLTAAQIRADKGAFFKSVHGTLNHILVADRIWLRRFTGDGPLPAKLDEVLNADLPGLRTAREAEDRRIALYIGRLTEANLEAAFRYRTLTNPREIVQPLATALSHFFNHQTHHRGQAHAILTALGGRAAAPELDLTYFQRETGMGMA